LYSRNSPFEIPINPVNPVSLLKIIMFPRKSRLGRIALCLIVSIASFSASSQPVLGIRTVPGAAELKFQATAGMTNQVQWINNLDNLAPTNWSALTNIVPASNEFVTVIDSSIGNGSNRFYRVELLPVSNTNPVVLLDNLTGSTGTDGLNVDIDQHIALGFNLEGSRMGTWSFAIRVDTSGGGASSAATLNLQLLDNHFNTTAMRDEPGTSEPILLAEASFISGIYAVSGTGSLAAGKYWLVASSTSPLDFYTWIDRGAYTESGVTLSGVRADLGDGSGWQVVNSTPGAGHPLSLRIRVVPRQ
jgi:hypothetical protein